MDAELQAYLDKKREKADAKAKSLAAVGDAKLAEAEGRDAAPYWAIVEAEGHAHGREGALDAEVQGLADAYVANHPEFFSPFDALKEPNQRNIDTVVALIHTFKARGQLEEAVKLDIFERVHFERQQIGSNIKARLPFGKMGG